MNREGNGNGRELNGKRAILRAPISAPNPFRVLNLSDKLGFLTRGIAFTVKARGEYCTFTYMPIVYMEFRSHSLQTLGTVYQGTV